MISSQIADIFRSNALKNGLLPVVLEPALVEELLGQPGIELRIDVASSSVEFPDGRIASFELDAFARTCLLEGVDQLGYLLKHEAAIARFEQKRSTSLNQEVSHAS